MHKPIYRPKDEWVLGTCDVCGNLEYVEPHGITAHCPKCKGETNFSNIPHMFRDVSGCYICEKPKMI